MAKIILNIPDNEFGVDIQNKFQDFFERVKAEIETRVESGDELVCGTYEIETAEMFRKAFEQMEISNDNVSVVSPTNGTCKECKYSSVHTISLDKTGEIRVCRIQFSKQVKDDYYCADFERKE